MWSISVVYGTRMASSWSLPWTSTPIASRTPFTRKGTLSMKSSAPIGDSSGNSFAAVVAPIRATCARSLTSSALRNSPSRTDTPRTLSALSEYPQTPTRDALPPRLTSRVPATRNGSHSLIPVEPTIVSTSASLRFLRPADCWVIGPPPAITTMLLAGKACPMKTRNLARTLPMIVRRTTVVRTAIMMPSPMARVFAL
jgi:hypothetical protein